MQLADLVRHVGGGAPGDRGRRAGDRRTGRVVTTVAVCGGSGGAYAELARAAGADAYVTADLRHHVSVGGRGAVRGRARRCSRRSR